MAEGDIDVVLDTLEFEGSLCNSPSIIQISDGIYAVVYNGTTSYGIVVTFSINSSGDIGAAVIDSYIFFAGTSGYHKITHVIGDVYLCSFQGIAGLGSIRTIRIESDGNIIEPFVSNNVFDSTSARMIDTIQVTNNIFAHVYSGPGDDGFVVTSDIAADGTITTPIVDTFEFDTVACLYPTIKHVYGDVFVIAYSGPGVKAIVCTVTIDSTGDIDASVIDSLEFDATVGSYPSMIHISGEIFAIAYVGPGSDGFLVTFSITNAGAISATVIDTFEFAPTDCGTPKIIPVSGNVYVICYYVPIDQGWLKTLTIATDGNINPTPIDSYNFSSDLKTPPAITFVTGDIYAVAYKTSANPGDVKTIGIETLLARMARHELIMGIG